MKMGIYEKLMNIQGKGKPYKDYLATIRRWARADKERKPKAKMNERPRQDDLDDLFYWYCYWFWL